MNANIKAHDLTSELFQLIGRYQALSTKVQLVACDNDGAIEFGAAVANLADAYQRLASCDLVIDASRDAKDHGFAFSINE